MQFHYSADFIFFVLWDHGFHCGTLKYAHSSFSSLVQSFLPKDTFLKTYLKVVNVYQLGHYQGGTLTKNMIYPYAIPFNRTHSNCFNIIC